MSEVWVVHPNEYEAGVAFVAASPAAALMRIDQVHQRRGPWTSEVRDGDPAIVYVQDRDGLYRYMLEAYSVLTEADSLARADL